MHTESAGWPEPMRCCFPPLVKEYGVILSGNKWLRKKLLRSVPPRKNQMDAVTVSLNHLENGHFCVITVLYITSFLLGLMFWEMKYFTVLSFVDWKWKRPPGA